jgi:hypothetical protein
VGVINRDTGALVRLTHEEDNASWEWAVIETLRLAGLEARRSSRHCSRWPAVRRISRIAPASLTTTTWTEGTRLLALGASGESQ